MHNIIIEDLDLQFFAEGAAAGDGIGDPGTGDNSAAAGQVRTLEDLGVPRDKAEKYRARKAKSAPAQNTGSAQETAEVQTAAAEGEVDPDEQAWEQAKKNPAINKKMQETVNARLNDYARKHGDAQGKLDQLAPLLELVGRKAGMDVSDLSKLDIGKLVEAVSDDPTYYEDLAAQMGTDIDTAKQIDQRERETERQTKVLKQQQQEMQLRQHYDGLVRQAGELQAAGYNIDLQSELADPWFARVTAPGGGLSVEQAFFAKYHTQIVNATKQNAAVQATQAVSNSIRAGRNMPRENGTTQKGPSPTQNKPYSQMNAEERAAYYKAMTGQQLRRRRY